MERGETISILTTIVNEDSRCQVAIKRADTSTKARFFVSILFPSSFLGYVDKLGVAYEAPSIATGFGAYLAQVNCFG